MKKIYKNIILIFSLGILCSCLPDSSAQNEIKIIHANIGGQDLYIPKQYVSFRHTSIGPEAALLQAWYPGSAIVPGNTKELWQQGQWWKNVMILASKRGPKKITFDEWAHKSTEHFEATEIVENEYGLIHRTQPKGANQDAYDLWTEEKNGEILSYITCSEKMTEISVPQCSQFMYWKDRLWLKIDYDARLLPEWKTIQNNIELMFISFEDHESSKEFAMRKLMEKNHAQP